MAGRGLIFTIGVDDEVETSGRAENAMVMARQYAEVAPQPAPVARVAPEIPAYLKDDYWWAYLHPASIAVFDHTPVVSAILWGQYGRLKQAALAEIEPGQTVLQAACVYGDLSPRLAAAVGPTGRLDVIDVAPLQVENCRRKLQGTACASVRLADAADPGDGLYDRVVCFFLMHELPSAWKRRVVDSLLDRVRPGGQAVFIDYHRPHAWHPLKPVTALVFRLLEPFAREMWDIEIRDCASAPRLFTWRKETLFGGLFQKVVARRKLAPVADF